MIKRYITIVECYTYHISTDTEDFGYDRKLLSLMIRRYMMTKAAMIKPMTEIVNRTLHNPIHPVAQTIGNINIKAFNIFFNNVLTYRDKFQIDQS